MLPENTGQTLAEYNVYPDKTYAMDLGKKRICGYYTGIEAMRQAVYKILATGRYEEIIYSSGYGTELPDLMGRLTPYAWSEIEHTIMRALLYDDRITAVKDFVFKENRAKRVLLVTFTVVCDTGSFEYNEEVELDV